ncbi:MAG: hypothetical protein FWH37_06155 [Candidatus Bathyarchaeota archaeon]|nr:hypothetical protein [Candidatus Termiticorpusculum sp.]
MLVSESSCSEENKNSKNEYTTNVDEQDEKERDRLIYDIIVKRYEQELQRTSNLDSKAYNIIGISGILSALIVAVLGYLYKSYYVLLFLVPFSLLIISAMLLCLFAYRVKSYEAIDPCEFIKSYSEKQFNTVLRTYTGTVAEITIRNHDRHEKKAKMINYAIFLIVLAIALFFVITVVFNWLV